jgi:hypothetical protein
MNSGMKLVGYWRSEKHPEYPDPHDFVIDEVDDEHQSRLLMALECGARVRFYMGLSPCRICGVANGAAEMTDGEHMWPEGLAHYVREHHVSLPVDVVDSLLRRFEELESPELDESWWLAETIDPIRASPALRWLREFDDPHHLEHPSAFDYVGEVERAWRLVAELSDAFGWSLTTDVGTSSVQDASFFGDVLIPAEANSSKMAIVVRLSNFGRLAVVVPAPAKDQDVASELNGHDRSIIATALRSNGYRLVSAELLFRPYDGRSDALRAAYPQSSATWWIRYFDYL